MRIGIVTPAFNVAPFIGDAIRSVLAQTHQDWTMTIIDDGSTDETASVAAAFHDRRVHVIRQSNAGVSAARNRGLVGVKAEAVLFLDADDRLSPDALTVLSAALRADPVAIASVGPYQRVSNDGATTEGVISRPASGELLEPLLVRNLFANGGHLLIRRAALRTAGSFHTGLCYGEDWEFWIRLACLGRFTATRHRAPLLFVRERHGGAYLSMATRPESFAPCMDAIFNSPSLTARFGAAALVRMRRRADAENDWIVGRELIRHGQWREAQPFLRRSVRAAPGLRRVALLVAGSLPMARIGPFRPYATHDAA